MARKLKLGWGEPKMDEIFSHCKGVIFNTLFYKDYSACWTCYEDEEDVYNLTYLVDRNGTTYVCKKPIPSKLVKKYIDSYNLIKNSSIWNRVWPENLN
jgi:hypothetical protein